MMAAAAFAAAQQPSAAAATKGTGHGQLVHITLPDEPAPVPPGPHVETYQQNCLICHSARYVTMQPKFPRATWEAEVKKMVGAYGASISEADQREIVEYLVAVRGTSEKK